MTQPQLVSICRQLAQMKNTIIVIIALTLLLLFSLGGKFNYIYGQITNDDNDETIDSFMECYSTNAANFMSANMFMPFTIDLTDPAVKKLISSMCEFYHENTGIWVDITKDRDIMGSYDQEFWSQYPIDELPEEIVKFYTEDKLN